MNTRFASTPSPSTSTSPYPITNTETRNQNHPSARHGGGGGRRSAEKRVQRDWLWREDGNGNVKKKMDVKKTDAKTDAKKTNVKKTDAKKTGKHRKKTKQHQQQRDERDTRDTCGDEVGGGGADRIGGVLGLDDVSGLDERRGLGSTNLASVSIRRQDVEDRVMLKDCVSDGLTVDERGWSDTMNIPNPPIKLEYTRQRGQERSEVAVARGQNTSASPYFAKVWMYSNSRLPSRLPPLQLHVPTYPLLCLAARHSLAVYDPCGSRIERPNDNSTRPARPGSINLCFPPSHRHATKAMTITSTTHDTTAHIILAIRGSSSLLDWATTNAHHAPTAPPAHFLPDQGNLVHAGFLHAALAMVSPIASHLRTLLEEKPERCSHSLTLTGHSAGGSIAALLYAHIMSLDYGTTSSPLKTTASACRRIHCITFGAAPVSLLPLSKPTPYPDMPREESKKVRRSVFMAFVNEGDPVVRADVAVFKSLLSLYTTPAPATGTSMAWPIPPGALSCAGSLILLRPPSSLYNNDKQAGATTAPAKPEKATRTGLAALLSKSRPAAGATTTAAAGNLTAAVTANANGVLASQITDGQLRDRVFGDPGVHGMAVYRVRVEALAFGAVTARSVGGDG